MPRLLLAALVCLLVLPATAQPQGAAERGPSAAPEDVASADAILAAVYDVISGPADEERDWDRLRSLFVPGARLIPTGIRDGVARAMVMTVDEYIERAAPFFAENGFFETEIARVEERYGPVVHAFSTYESRYAADDPEPFMRGINSFQLLDDGRRWWIVTIYWHGETPETPIPDRYLPEGR